MVYQNDKTTLDKYFGTTSEVFWIPLRSSPGKYVRFRLEFSVETRILKQEGRMEGLSTRVNNRNILIFKKSS